MTHEHLNVYMGELIDTATREKRTAMAMAAFLKTARARKFVEPALCMRGDTVRTSFFVTGGSMHVTLRVDNLEGFKDERLAGILTTYEYLNPDKQTVNEFAQYYNKEFRFHWYDRTDDGIGLSVYVIVDATIKNDSSTCKRVVVGMSTPEPQPVYKMVCDGQDDPTTANDAAPVTVVNNAATFEE